MFDYLERTQFDTLTSIELLDIASLFPSSSVSNLLKPHISQIQPVIEKLVRSLNQSVKVGLNTSSLKYLTNGLDALLSSALAGAVNAIVRALSLRGERSDAVDRVEIWLRAVRDVQGQVEDELLDNGLTTSQFIAGTGAVLMNTILAVPVPSEGGPGRVVIRTQTGDDSDVKGKETPTPEVCSIVEMIPDVSTAVAQAALVECAGSVEEAIGRLLDGWRPASSAEVGKRVDRRARKRVGEVLSFGGEKIEAGRAEWYARRVVAEEARTRIAEEERMTREAVQSGMEDSRGKNSATDGLEDFVELNISGGVYDDEPDDGELEGEVAMRSLASVMGNTDDSDDGVGGLDTSEVGRDGYEDGRRANRISEGSSQYHAEAGHGNGGHNISRGGTTSNRGSGRGRGRARGRGRGSGSRNHNRKTRAAKKQGGM